MDTRFDERWAIVGPPHAPDQTPDADAASSVHPYLQRIRSKRWKIVKLWAVRLHPSATSIDDPARLVYSYVNEARDTNEAVIIDDAEKFTRWVAATLRSRLVKK